MQDEAANKLLTIFKELQQLQIYHKEIKRIKRRLEKIMDLKSDTQFEWELAANIHPFMYSYPEPLGDRYRDVESLLQEITKNQTLRDVKHQKYIEQILPLREKGYRYAVCRSFSPSNSGINIDPASFSFGAKASDNCLYFAAPKPDALTETQLPESHVTCDNNFADSHAPENHGAPKIQIETSLAAPSTCPQSRDTHPGSLEVKEGLCVGNVPVSRPDSMICNPSSYQSLANSSSSSSCETPSNFPTPENQTSSSRNVTRADDFKTGSSTGLKLTPAEEEIVRYKEFYTTPVSRLPLMDTCSRQQTVRTMVVSQTWLTGWIRELYQLEDQIFGGK